MSIRSSLSFHKIVPEGQMRLAGHPGAERISSGVRDPILASAVHLRGGSGGIVVVSLDLLGLDPATIRTIRSKTLKATGTPEHHVFIGVTQTHSAPAASDMLYRINDPCYSSPDPQYLDKVIEQAVVAASESTVTSRPVSVATISLPQPSTGAILVKDSSNGRIIAVILIYRDIPDYLGPNNSEISSDYIHSVRERLTKRFGVEPVVTFFCGPSGDQKLAGTARQGDRSDPIAAGKDLANAVVTGIKGLSSKDFSSNMSFSGQLIDVPELPRRKLMGDAEIARMMTQALSNATQTNDNPARMRETENSINLATATKSGQLDPMIEQYSPTTLHLLRIGDTKILGMPGSLTSRCANRIAEEAGENLWIAECVNGDMQGAIIDINDESTGSYRIVGSPFAPQAGDILVKAAINACNA